MLFETEGDTRVRVIRIRSDSLPVVSTKLIVYKNFKHVINEKGFFLQHEYDEIDDLAKLIAYRVILSFCSSIESLINAFTVDLPKSMADYFDKQLTLHKPLRADKIRIICSDVLEKMGYKPFESAKSTRYQLPIFLNGLSNRLILNRYLDQCVINYVEENIQ